MSPQQSDPDARRRDCPSARSSRKLQITAPTNIRWKERFLAGRIDGLDTYHPGLGFATVLSAMTSIVET